MFGGRMLARVARNIRAPRVALAAAGAAGGLAMYTAPAAQANPSIGEMLTTIAAKVEALETKMASGGSPTGFGSFDMAGKAVIITGGASGIGYGMCELFSQRGSKVFCLDLFPEAVKKAEEELGPNVRSSPRQQRRPPMPLRGGVGPLKLLTLPARRWSAFPATSPTTTPLKQLSPRLRQWVTGLTS